MSDSPIVVPFNAPSVYDQIQSIAEPLVSCMKEHDPSITDQKFQQQFVLPLRDAGSEAVTAFLTKLQSAPPDDPLDRRFAPILMSVGFCVLAAQAHENRQEALALALLLEAKYWCGASVATKGILQAYRRTEGEVVHRRQSRSGQGNNADVRAEVERAVLEEYGTRPQEFTAAKMAENLKDELVAFANASHSRSLKGRDPEWAIKKLIEKNPTTAALVKKLPVGRPPKNISRKIEP